MIIQTTPVACLVLANQKNICPFDRQLDIVSKLVKNKGLSIPQLSWEQKQFHVCFLT